MNCEEALIFIYDLVDNEIDNSDRLLLQSHLDSCADCRAKLTSIQTMESIYLNEIKAIPAEDLAERIVSAAEQQHILTANKWSLSRVLVRGAAVLTALAASLFFIFFLPTDQLFSQQMITTTTSFNSIEKYDHQALYVAMSNIKSELWLAQIDSLFSGATQVVADNLTINNTLLIIIVTMQIVVSFQILRRDKISIEDKRA